MTARTRVLALLVAAFLGTLGGVGTALTTSSSQERAGDAPQDPADPPADDATPAREPLLYAVPGEIHDGSDVVAFREGTGTRSLTRRDGGYLVGTFEGPDDNETLWTVGADGTVTRVAYVAPGWDVDPGRTRVVAHDLEEDRLTTYDAVTGEPLGSWDDTFGPQDAAAYAGSSEQVLVSRRTDPTTYELLRWAVGSGTTTSLDGPGYSRMVTSPDGGLVVGAVAPDGSATEDESSCLQMHATSLTDQEASWQTCEWTGLDGSPAFSPDGTRLLVRPAAASDDAPTVPQLAVLDAVEGPEDVVARFEGDLDALGYAWADDDHVYVLAGGSTGENGRISRCDLDGACTRLVGSRPPCRRSANLGDAVSRRPAGGVGRRPARGGSAT